MSLVDIRGAFDGQNVFITGFTGFVGKVLTEKLLRSCSQVKHIYVLMREKKGKSISERLDAILSDPLFSVLEKNEPKFRHRITPLTGDCALPGLGLSPEERQLLINEVGIVFHGAATVRFDEQLKVAFNINIRGTREVLDLAREMKNLKGFIHVSTAYANCHKNEIEERLYESPIDVKKLEDMINTLDEDILTSIQPKLLGKWPNTYAFTKAVAEHVVHDYGRGIPRIIFRPAIVVGTDREPVIGWTDNVYGPTGLVVGAGCGLLHSVFADTNMTANIVPVDYLVNALIAAAAAVVHDQPRNGREEVKIYNYVSCKDNPLSWAEFKRLIEIHGKDVPPVKAVWCYFLTIHKNWATHFICTMLFHYLPALIMDSITWITRSDNPNMYQIYKKVDKYGEVLAFFSTRDWQFTNQNVRALLERVPPKDREEFTFDISQLDWDKFFYNYIRGLRVYLLKDGWETLPRAQIKWRRFVIAHQIIKYVGLLILVRLAWMIASPLFSS
uniref:Fatty acyl-CoA reductase n=2 Tax=Lygus hesperus TaxID=30085 RepID=A0A0A9WBX3_LYGHE